MASPDMSHRSSEVEWSIDSTYRPSDNYGSHTCAMTGFPQRKGEVVYRGPHVDDFLGFFAIGHDAAEQLARLVGFIDPDDLIMTPDEELLIENEGLRAEVASLQDRLEQVLSAVAS